MGVDIIKGILDGIISFFQFLVDFVGTFFSFLGDCLVSLFKPNQNALIDGFNDLQQSISKKVGLDLGVIEDLSLQSQTVAYSNSFPIEPIKFVVFGTPVIIDLSFLSKIQPYSYTIASSLVAIWLCYYHYSNIIFFLKGSDPPQGGNSGGSSNLPSNI